MFVINSSIKNLVNYINAVWEVYGSVNQPIIALPDRSPEPTWAYVIAIKEGKNMQIFVYLFREQSREGVFYTYEGGKVELVNAKAVFNEALDFTGSMGFIMEKVELGETEAQRIEIVKNIPAFLTDLSTYKLPSTGSELILDNIYESPATDTKESEILKTKGGKQWLAKVLSLF